VANIYEWQAEAYKVGEHDSLRNLTWEMGGVIKDEIWHAVKPKTQVRILFVNGDGMPTGRVFAGAMWDAPREFAFWHLAGRENEEAYPLYPIVWSGWGDLDEKYQSKCHAVAAFFAAKNRDQQALMINRWRAHGAQYSQIARVIGWMPADVRLLHHSMGGGVGLTQEGFKQLDEQQRRRAEIRSMFGEGMSLKEIAERMGVSSSRINQIVGRIQRAEETEAPTEERDPPRTTIRSRLRG
jgi:hypothetical protein